MPPLAPVMSAIAVMVVFRGEWGGINGGVVLKVRLVQANRPALQPRPQAKEESVCALHHPGRAWQAADHSQPAPAG